MSDVPVPSRRPRFWPERYIRSSYGEHLRRLPFRHQQVGVAVLAAAALVLPYSGVSGYVVGIVTFTMIAAIGVIGLNFLTGSSGQVSLGQAGFLAVGAYTTAVLAGRFDVPFLLTMPAAALLTALISVIIGLPTLRLRGFYVAMVTFAFHFAVQAVLTRWRFVGGQTGLSVQAPSLFGFSLGGGYYYYLVLVVTAVMLLVAFNIQRSGVGRAWGSIRDRDVAAAALGIRLSRYKLVAYAWHGVYVGVAGSLLAGYFNYITPDNFPFMLAVQYLAMILVGGMGTVLGSVFGAVFIVLLPEAVRVGAGVLSRYVALPPTFLGDAQLVVFGLLIIVTLVFAPKGLFGFWEDVKTYLKSWPFTY